MSTLNNELLRRSEEFQNHLRLAAALDERLFISDPATLGEMALTTRHISTIKSGLIVHLYNIVESTMARTIKDVALAVKSLSPSEWSDKTLKEWLRHHASTGIDGNEDSRLDVVHKAARKLLSKDPIDNLGFKKPSGTWSDKLIYSFSKRLDVDFSLNEVIAKKLAASPRYGEKTPLEFLAERRNAIAHGSRSFEDGASDLTLRDIEELSEITLEYMNLVISAFQKFIDKRKYSTLSSL
jgi:hypothetical protein